MEEHKTTVHPKGRREELRTDKKLKQMFEDSKKLKVKKPANLEKLEPKVTNC